MLAALANPERRIERILATKEVADRHAKELGSRAQILSREDMAHRLPAGAVHQGIAALVAPLEEPGLEDVLARCGDHALVLALDQITDPHNVGAILRSAAAFGAAAVIVMSDTRAEALGITPLARIVSSGVSGLNPEIMGLGPVEASRRALALAGMTIDDVDLVEINEAFAAQVLPSARALGISEDKLNVNGGAIALGHPFGMTGARIMGTLLNGLEDSGGTVGLETMCVGGGQGMAMIVERLS